MGKITSITAQKKDKDRCNIFIDGEYVLCLSLETVVKNRLKVGSVVTESELNEIALESEKIFAFNKALSYVSKALKTKKQVIIYLKDKGFCDAAVYYAVDKLKEYNYINDKEYAKLYLESAVSQGKRLSEYKLMTKGIKKEDISTVYDSLDLPTKENAALLAEKRMKNKEHTKENIAKTYRYLIGRGFSYEEAEFALSKFKEED